MRRLLCGFALLALATGPAGAQIVSGSFESGTDPGATFLRLTPGATDIGYWSVVAGNVDYLGTQIAACHGTRSVDLNGNGPGAISQTFATTPGQGYRVTFCLAGNPQGTAPLKTLNVWATGGPTTGFEFDTTGRAVTAPGWVFKYYDFTATAASTTLTFASTTPTAFGPLVDAVSIQTAPRTQAVSASFADFWWVPEESGWGMNVSQQNDVIFATLFVYDGNSQPMWLSFAATPSPANPASWSGELYRSTGPVYSGPFDPDAVTRTKVGTATLTFTGNAWAVLTYTVGATTVTKNVTRTAYNPLPLAGSYYLHDQVRFGCGGVTVPPDVVNNDDETVGMSISVTGNAIRIDLVPNCTLQGTWTQYGSLVKALGTATGCFGAPTASWQVTDMSLTDNLLLFHLRFAFGAPLDCTTGGGLIGMKK